MYFVYFRAVKLFFLSFCYERSKFLFVCISQLEDTLWAGLTDQHIKTPMGVTAENLAEKYELTREQCDAFALRSQQRWKKGGQFGRNFGIADILW